MTELRPITARCDIPRRSDAEARAIDVRIALLEALHRYRIELTTARARLRDAIDEDRTELIDAATEQVERLSSQIRHLTEELALS